MIGTFLLECIIYGLLIGYVLLPAGAWYCSARFLNGGASRVLIFLLTVGVGYFLYVGCVMVVGEQLRMKVDSFDLDGDPGLSEAEYTPEAREAMRRFTSDTGRTFAPIIVGPVTFFWVSLNYFVLSVVSALVKLTRRQRN